jgi:hypothetical protein
MSEMIHSAKGIDRGFYPLCIKASRVRAKENPKPTLRNRLLSRKLSLRFRDEAGLVPGLKLLDLLTTRSLPRTSAPTVVRVPPLIGEAGAAPSVLQDAILEWFRLHHLVIYHLPIYLAFALLF